MNLVKLDQRGCGDLLSEPDTKAYVVHAIILATYGADALYGGEDPDDEPINPAELYLQLETDFRCTLPPEIENKIRAAQMAVETLAFYNDPFLFTAIAKSLADGDIADLIQGIMVDLTLPEMLWAIHEVNLLRDEEEQPEFGPAVVALILKEMAEWNEENIAGDTAGALLYLQNEHAQLIQEMEKAGFNAQQVRAFVKAPAFDNAKGLVPA